MDNVLISRITSYLSTIPVEKAWIFGSYSRGEATAASDLDILVQYSQGFRPGLFGICAITEQLEQCTGIKVDLVENGTLYPAIASEVAADQIQIYERSSSRS